MRAQKLIITAVFLLGGLAALSAATTPLPLSPTRVIAAQIDIGAEIIIDSAEQVPENPVDKDRCIAVAMLQFDDVPGAKNYEFSLTDTLDHWGDFSLSEPINNFPFGGIDMVQDGWYTRQADEGKHLYFLSSGSTGQGCTVAEAGFAGRFEILSSKANVGAPVAEFTFEIDENDPFQVHFDASASTGDQLSYDWVWDAEGTTGGYERTDPTPSNQYFEAGTYPVTLTVTDSNLDTDEVTHEVTIIDKGKLQGTVFGDDTVESDVSIAYNGPESGSMITDEDGHYAKFVPLGSYVVTAPSQFCYTGNTTACQNAVPVTIGRTNGQLIVVPERVDFDLPEHDPTAMIKVTRAPNDSYSFIFDAGGSTDPDNDIETYHWNFGDEMVAEGLTATHTYTDNTERTVVLRVIDAQGNDDVVQVTIRPGTFTVSGHLYEQVCGRPSTRFVFQSPQFVQIDAHGTDGFQSFRADSDGRYEVEAAPGDFSVFANAALVPTQATKPFPAWEPAIHFFDLQADTPDRDFELCYDPIAPAQANIVTRNARFVSDTLTLRNGGIVRICDEDGLSRDVDGFGKAGGEDIFFIGHIEGRRVSTVPGGCISLPVSNSAPTPMHLELISSGAFGVFKIIVVVLPGTGAPGLTTLTAPAQSGSNRLVVASNDGFLPGDDLLLDPDGPGEATYEMLATGSLILTAPLSRSYPAGTVIVNYSSPPPGFSDASPGATDNGGSGRDDSGTPVMDGSNFPTLGGVPVPAAPVATPSVTPVGEVSGVRQISPPSTGSGGLKKGRSTAVGGLVVLFATCVAVRLHVRLRRNA